MTAGVFMGIDPGVSGAISVIDKQRNVLVAQPMPREYTQIATMFAYWRPRILFIVLEKVWAMGHRRGAVKCPACKRPMGQSDGAMQSFAFGGNFHALKMALACYKLPYEEVAAITWQTRLGIKMHGRSDVKKGTSAKKNANKDFAQMLWPNQKITLKTADSLLLAEVALQMHGERLFK